MSELDQGQTPSTPLTVVSKAERARLAREALIGKTIAGRYVLRSLLGHGGMGAVYEGEHVGIGKRVAIKFVDPEFVTDEQILTRFAREARVMSTLESPHIVSIFDAGTEDGRPYLVMELLRGEDLGQRLRRTTRVGLAESLHIIAMVLKGLSKAHAAGIVHRDLKPDNIFLVKIDDDPIFAKIVDFGVSKIERPRNRTSPLALTGRGTVLGTPFYMSPEQAQAVPDLDGRADLFSVGTILFECLAGRPPFTGETYEQIILAICMRDAPPLSSLDPAIPENVSRFVAKALARERADRFASADEMLAALHELSPDEKRRVPADPPMNQTLLAGGGMAAFTPAPLGGSNPTAPATPIGVQRAQAVLAEAHPASVTPPTMVSPLATSASDVLPAPQRSNGAVIVSAVLAALLGVVATLVLVSIFANKPAVPAAPVPSPPVASASAAARASIAPPAHAPPPVSVTAAPTLAPKPAPAPTPAPGLPKPKPSARPLDISRDLP